MPHTLIGISQHIGFHLEFFYSVVRIMTLQHVRYAAAHAR